MPNRDYYLDADNENFSRAREALPAYMAAMLQRSGMTENAAAEAANAIYALEEKLARVQWDTVTNRDPDKTYNAFPVQKLPELGEQFDWNSVLSELSLDEVEQIVIRQPDFFEALDGLLAEVPLETWKNYMTYRVMDSRAVHLDQQTFDLNFDYRNRILRGQQEPMPRWKLGIRMVDNMVGEAVGKLYVKDYFPPEAKARMETLVENVIATLDDSIDDLEWMGPETREKAREKLSKFTPKIGYPDVWKDYSDLEIVAGDHLGNVRRTYEWSHQQDVDRLGGPGGSHRVAHDTTNGQCLLQPHAERDRLPGRTSATPVLPARC